MPVRLYRDRADELGPARHRHEEKAGWRTPDLDGGTAAGLLFLAAAAVALWLSTIYGLDGTNAAQRQDLLEFHLPTIRFFSTSPLSEAVMDYYAAPFPLFYIVFGALHSAMPGTAVLHAASAILALGVIVTACLILRQRRVSPTATAAVILTILISPYFRGTAVFANTDVMPVLFFLLTILLLDTQAGGSPSRMIAGVRVRDLLILAFAFLAFHARQFYAFLPVAAALLLLVEGGPQRRAAVIIASIVFAVPALYLVVLWGGPTPLSFQASHARAGALPATLLAVLANFGFYALAPAVATLVFYRREFLTTIRTRRFLVLFSGLAAVVVPACLLAKSADLGGGGMVLKALDMAVPWPTPRAIVLGACALAAGGYALYLTLQSPLRNLSLPLFLAALLPTSTIFQRYFDPILFLILLSIGTRETRELLKTRLVFLFPGLEMLVSFAGIAFYR